MFDTVIPLASPAGRRHRVALVRRRGVQWREWRDAQAGAGVAREHAPGYDATPPSPGAVALAQLDAALAALGQVDWAGESDADVNTAVVALQRRVAQLQAQGLRGLAALQRRETYARDGAATAASWLRNRLHLDHAPAQRLCSAARRLGDLPALAEAFAAGAVTLAHVEAVTEAAVPSRAGAIAAVHDTLVALARTANPRALRVALRTIRDGADPDGTDPDTLDGDEEAMDGGADDPRRYWTQSRTIDGLVKGDYLVGGILGEMLAILFDAFSTADAADTPPTRRRSPAQQRADAMHAAVKAILDAGLAPAVQGNKAHLLLMVDLLTLMGRDAAATFAAELRRHGRVSAHTIATLGLDARVTPVLTMGRWRVVAVGRTHRTLPPWLRPMLEMLHRRCRGPDCDRPACWTQAHHLIAWALGGPTDLNLSLPLCAFHHDLVTTKGWTVTLDHDTGIATWTTPDGRIIHTYPER